MSPTPGHDPDSDSGFVPVPLEGAFRCVADLADLILTDAEVRKRLEESTPENRIEFWRAFYQVILSAPFGLNRPNMTDAGKDYPQLIQTKYEEYRGSGLVDTEPLDRFNTSKCVKNDVLFLITNFWNADGERIPAHVARPLGAEPGSDAEARTTAWWRQAWDLMTGINGKEGEDYPKDWGFSPHSIGTFVVARSRQLNRACPFFEMRIGPREHYTKFEEFAAWAQPRVDGALGADCLRLLELLPQWYAEMRNVREPLVVSRSVTEDFGFGALEVPAAVVRCLLVEEHDIPPLPDTNDAPPRRGALKDLLAPGALGTEDPVKLVRALVARTADGGEAWSAWTCACVQTFLAYFGCFILWRFYRDPRRGALPRQQIDTSRRLPSDAERRLLLLNNLLITPGDGASERRSAAVSEDPDTWFYHYCLPTWGKSASYIYLVLRKNKLQPTHLIAFQNLADHLLRIGWTSDSVRKQEEDLRRIIENGKRAARAAIMARNMSHNIGSHVLASISAVPGYGVPVEEHASMIAAVFAFLQTRMDFIARITTAWPDWSQPLYFVKDILLPLATSLRVVVRNLVSAQWAGNIEFVVYACETNEPVVLQIGARSSATPDITADRLVLIPEGFCGVHAIYVLLENLLRNSVKYGTKADNKCLRVYLTLRDGPDRFALRVWDNFSKNRADGGTGTLVEEMQQKYQAPLTDEATGELSNVDWGVQETVACATFLMHPDDDPARKCISAHAVTLNGEDADPRAPDAHLCVEVLLKRPRFLAIIPGAGPHEERPPRDPGERKEAPGAEPPDARADTVPLAEGVDAVNSLQALAASHTGCSLTLIDLTDPRHWAHRLGELARLHRSLPYRLLAVTRDELVAALSACIGEYADRIPRRRVVVVPSSEAAPPGAGAGPGDWEVFLLRVHAHWIAQRYGTERGALVVSFDQGENGPLLARWAKRLAGSSPHAAAVNAVLDVALLEANTGGSRLCAWRGLDAAPDDAQKDVLAHLRGRAGAAVVYDNHDRLLAGGLTITPRMSIGNANLKTFNPLQHPPADDFAFNSFVLTLYEAGLASVVVIDERVAAAGFEIELRRKNELEWRTNWRIRHDNLNAARCYPHYSARGPGGTVRPLCDAHAVPPRAGPAPADTVDRARVPIAPDEGVDLVAPEQSRLWCRTPAGGAGKHPPGAGATAPVYTVPEPGAPAPETETAPKPAVAPDFVVIHQGLIDTLFSNAPEATVQAWVARLYRVAPVVVVTSGRGLVRRTKVQSDVPFVEFSMIKNAIYPELCKPDLFATLAAVKSVKGEPP